MGTFIHHPLVLFVAHEVGKLVSPFNWWETKEQDAQLVSGPAGTQTEDSSGHLLPSGTTIQPRMTWDICWCLAMKSWDSCHCWHPPSETEDAGGGAGAGAVGQTPCVSVLCIVSQPQTVFQKCGPLAPAKTERVVNGVIYIHYHCWGARGARRGRSSTHSLYSGKLGPPSIYRKAEFPTDWSATTENKNNKNSNVKSLISRLIPGCDKKHSVPAFLKWSWLTVCLGVQWLFLSCFSLGRYNL